MEKENSKEVKVSFAKFDKQTLLKAKDLLEHKDALGAIMSDDEMLTVPEAKKRLEDFYKRSVK